MFMIYFVINNFVIESLWKPTHLASKNKMASYMLSFMQWNIVEKAELVLIWEILCKI